MRTSLKFPLTRTTLTTNAFNRLKQAILEGRFPPGARLVESRLAEAFGISRAPVREALRQLKQEGLVMYIAHRGYFVPQFSLNDLEELFLLRMALEKLAVRLAILFMTSQELAKLEDIVQRMESLQNKDPSRSRATELDVSFHKHLCKMSHSKRLLNIWSSMLDQIGLAILASNRSFPARAGYAEGHRAILEAIRSLDVELAESIIERHILTGLEQLKSSSEVLNYPAQFASTSPRTENQEKMNGKTLL